MATTTDRLPSLESGERLTREEFHRRYCARLDIHKAELVDGVVDVTTRVTFSHGPASAMIAGWAGVYAAYAPGIHTGIHPTTMMATRRARCGPNFLCSVVRRRRAVSA